MIQVENAIRIPFFGEVQLLASMFGLPPLLCSKLLQNMQEKRVGHSQGVKTEWCDWHWMVGFSVELLEKPGALGPSSFWILI